MQTEFRYEEDTEYSEPMANWVEFEVKMNLPYKEAQPSDPITIPELQVNAMSGAMGETDEITASPCAYYWQAPEPNEDGTMSSIIGCGPAIGEETSLPEITATRAGLISHRKSNEIWLYFEVQPDTVRIQCVPQNGGEVETITDILPYDGGPQEELEKIFDSARANVSCAWEKGVLLAAGSDAGAYRVLHGQGLVDEYQIFCDLFGETEELKNRLKEGESVIRRKFQAEKFGS